MGYYSEVSILCGRNVAKKLVELPELFGADITKRLGGTYQFYWESVKWYEGSFKEVDAVMEIVNKYLHKDFGPDGPDKPDFCSYIRIGEDLDDSDCECNSFDWDSQWIQKKVCIDGEDICDTGTHDEIKKKFNEEIW